MLDDIYVPVKICIHNNWFTLQSRFYHRWNVAQALNLISVDSLDLHSEIEELKSRVSGHKSHVSQLEVELSDTKCKAEQETTKLQEELSKLRERYDR